MTRQWRGLVAGLGLAMLACACGGDEQASLTGAGGQDAGVTACTCIDLSTVILSNNLELCDCPEIQYGCAQAPQTFERICDLAPPCWETAVDPQTGCEMPKVPSLPSEACSCL